MTDMQWAPQQNEALEKVRRWIDSAASHDNKQIFRLFGFAGSGKTTLAIAIADMVKECQFAAFTGKAALVMRKKGCFGAQTIHSLIYKPRRDWRGEKDKEENDTPQWELNPDSTVRYADLVIVDECSMVGEELARDLLSFGTPVLVLGDPAQLPPVSGAGFFTDHEPDAMLTEIHRQAADNPIIRIATDIRLGRGVQIGTHAGQKAGAGVAIIKRANLVVGRELWADQILCGKNDTRVTINRRIRSMLQVDKKLPTGQGNLPVVGDRVICLKNKRDRALLNGGMFIVTELLDRMPEHRKPGKKGVSYLELKDDMNRVNHCKVPHQYWFWNNRPADLNLPEGIQRAKWDEFDYAYAITCHKSQGSQWDKVLIHDEGHVFERSEADEGLAARWLYTALTRAAEAAVIVKG